jgi:hypothetical protein
MGALSRRLDRLEGEKTGRPPICLYLIECPEGYDFDRAIEELEIKPPEGADAYFMQMPDLGCDRPRLLHSTPQQESDK